MWLKRLKNQNNVIQVKRETPVFVCKCVCPASNRMSTMEAVRHLLRLIDKSGELLIVKLIAYRLLSI